MSTSNSLARKTAHFIFVETLLDLPRWLAWWYSAGLKRAFLQMFETIEQGNADLSLSIWIKNLFTPMFGQYDWQGRIISFLVRLMQIIFRSIAFLFWIAFALIVFLIWLILPAVLIVLILYYSGLFGQVMLRWPQFIAS